MKAYYLVPCEQYDALFGKEKTGFDAITAQVVTNPKLDEHELAAELRTILNKRINASNSTNTNEAAALKSIVLEALKEDRKNSQQVPPPPPAPVQAFPQLVPSTSKRSPSPAPPLSPDIFGTPSELVTPKPPPRVAKPKQPKPPVKKILDHKTGKLTPIDEVQKSLEKAKKPATRSQSQAQQRKVGGWISKF